MSLVIEALHKNLPNAAALRESGTEITYGELAELTAQTATQLDGFSSKCVALDIENSITWAAIDLAFITQNIISLPLPPFFTPQQRMHAMEDAGAVAIITDKTNPAFTLLKHLNIAGRKLYLYAVPNTHKQLPPATAKITYTSGTTGNPKGICLTQNSMEQVASSLVTAIGKDAAKQSMAVLPLGILLENIGGLYASILAGGCYVINPLSAIGFAENFRPDFIKLAKSLNDEKATSCILVPELLKGLVFTKANLPHMEFMAVGGARIASGILDEAEKLGLPVYQGYGLSEAASVVAVNIPAANKKGSVGKLLPHIKYSISTDGEIILHNSAIPGNSGEYATGDTAYIDDEGYLFITGRKKNVIINSFGRNISPEWVESELTANPLIAQAYVYGDGEPEISALIVPAAKDIKPEQLLVIVTAANGKLPEYAQVKNWSIALPFTLQNGMLTGTGRLKRAAIKEFYKTANEEEVCNFMIG